MIGRPTSAMSVLQGNLCKLMNASWPAATCRFSSKRAAIASVENQLGIQPKPKKPVGAFLRFTSKIRPELVQKYPTASITDLVKLAAAEWKNVDSQTKAQLQEETKAEWARYMEECRKYESQLSPGVKLQLENAAKKIQIAKEKKVLKKKREDLGRPKKPPTSFVMFFLSKSAERGTMPFKEWQAKMAKAWEELPEAEKSKIIAAHKKETEEYKQRLTDWEKKMVAEGKSELITVNIARETNQERSPMDRLAIVAPPSPGLNSLPHCFPEKVQGSVQEHPKDSIYEKERQRIIKNIVVYRRITIFVTSFGILSLLACFLTAFALVI